MIQFSIDMPNVPYETELIFAALSMLAQGRKHGETTFGPTSQTLFERLRKSFAGTQIDADEIVRRICAGETIDGDNLALDAMRVMELEMAFRAAGLASSLPKKN